MSSGPGSKTCRSITSWSEPKSHPINCCPRLIIRLRSIRDTLWLESFYYRVPPILVNLHSAPPVFAFKILEDVGLVIRDLGRAEPIG